MNSVLWGMKRWSRAERGKKNDLEDIMIQSFTFILPNTRSCCGQGWYAGEGKTPTTKELDRKCLLAMAFSRGWLFAKNDLSRYEKWGSLFSLYITTDIKCPCNIAEAKINLLNTVRIFQSEHPSKWKQHFTDGNIVQMGIAFNKLPIKQ